MLFKTIRLTLLLSLSLLIMSGLSAQEDKSKRPSPPVNSTKTIGSATVSIDYSAPSVKGRTIFGDLVPHGKVWRTGANEATVFETSADIKVNGQDLPKGRYALFTIPGENEWTVIFNTESDQWGAYRYKDAKDQLRLTVKPSKGDFSEKLAVEIDGENNVHIKWADTVASFKVEG